MNITICPYCHTGRLRQQPMTYVQWHGTNLLVVNRMPAIVCDVCGERAYDDRAVEQLQSLLMAGVENMVPPRSYHVA